MLKGACTGSSVSKLVKKAYCWKSHFVALLQDKYTQVNSATFVDSFIFFFHGSTALGWQEHTTSCTVR